MIEEKFDKKIIFVDCFNTVIIRNKKNKDILRSWAEILGQKYNIPWQDIYKGYKKINFNLCFKKIFTKLVLQEHFEVVLEKLHQKLQKKYNELPKTDFIQSAKEIYIGQEMNSHRTNMDIVNLLTREKENGKRIYLVSDFYCPKEFLKNWLSHLQIADLFDDIFSSCDFDKEKSTTKLYRHLLKTLEINPKDVIMLGDNAWSDVLMARICKIKAKKITFRG